MPARPSRLRPLARWSLVLLPLLGLGAALPGGEVSLSQGQATISNQGLYPMCFNGSPRACTICELPTGKMVTRQLADPNCTYDFSTIAYGALSYIHHSDDYAPVTGGAPASTGCATGCGSGGAEGSALPALRVRRYMRYRDTGWPSSFGPGMFWHYDASVTLSTSVDGNGVTQRSVRVFLPELDQPYTARQQSDGGFRETSFLVTDQVSVLSGTGAVLTTFDDPAAPPVTVVVRMHDGTRYTFAVLAALNNQSGRLVSVADRNGNQQQVAYAYAADATLADLGNDTAKLRRITQVTDAYGKTATVSYRTSPVGGAYAISGIALPNGTSLSYTYDDPSLVGLSQVNLPDGSTSTITARTDAASQCRVISFVDRSGGSGSRRAEIYFSQNVWVDPNGVSRWVSANRVRMVVDGTGAVAFMAWYTPGLGQSALNSDGQVRLYVYEHGTMRRLWLNVLSIERSERITSWDLSTDPDAWPAEPEQSYALDSARRATSALDGAGRLTTATYSGAYMTATSYPDGSTESFAYNAFNDLTQRTDRLGRTTQWTYDGNGNRLSETTAVGTAVAATRSWTYNARGQVVTATDAAGKVTDYTYTTAGYLASVTEPADVPGPGQDGLRATWTYTYDAAGNRTGSVDPKGNTATFTFDSRNRLTRTTYGDGTWAGITYGTGQDGGLVVARTDRLGHVTAYAYDLAGRLVQTTSADATVETIAYVPGTKREASRTRAGSLTTFAYNHAGERVATTRRAGAASLTEQTAYDRNGQALQRTDPYGRRSYQVLDRDGRMSRQVQELLPGLIPGDASLLAAATANVRSSYQLIGIGGHAGTPGTVLDDGTGGVTMSLAATGYTTSGTESSSLYSRQLGGDGVAALRVTAYGPGGGATGLMMRGDTTAGAAMVALYIDLPGGSVRAAWRQRVGDPWQTRSLLGGRDPAAPVWMQLQRQGSLVLASASRDGVLWTRVAVPAELPAVVEVGPWAAALSTWTPWPWTTSMDGVSVTPVSASAGMLTQARDAYLRGLTRAGNPDLLIQDWTYDAAGQVLSSTDPRGTVDTMHYDAQGRVDSRTAAAGSAVAATTAITYDARGLRTSVTEAAGTADATTTTMSYTGRGLLRQVTEAAGTAEAATTTTTYTLTRKTRTVTDALNRVTSYTYGTCCDRLIAIVDPANFITSFSYDADGQRLTVTDPNTLTTATAYDAMHRVASVSNAAQQTTTYAYDENLLDGQGLDAVPAVAAAAAQSGFAAGVDDGSAVAVTDPTGATVYELRDGLGRTVARIDALLQVTRFAYDAIGAGTGNLVESTVTDALGRATRSRADGAGRIRLQVDALGHATTATFDGAGNQLSQRDAGNVGWDASYDARGRLTSRSDTRSPAGTTSWTYDLDGNRLTETDALGRTETSTYDARNRRITLVDRVNGTTRFAYDAVGNLISISDADNEAASPTIAKTTQYAYDLRNLLVAEAFPGGQQGRTLRVYAYDGGRRLTQRSVGILSGAFGATPAFNGTPTVTTYAYDGANRLTTRGYADNRNDTFVYDAASRLTEAFSARYATTVQRFYDAAGRLTSETLGLPDGSLVGTTLAPATYTVGYGYDAANRLVSLSYPTGATVARTYTERNELDTVSLGGQQVIDRAYDASGRLTQTVVGGNLLTETRGYVPGTHLPASLAIPGVSGFSYTYDAVQRKTTEGDASRNVTQSFGYDDGGRLTSWSEGVTNQAWTLTPVGDWTSTTRNGAVEARQHSAVHEATQVGSMPLSYDVQGNLTVDERQTALAWDPENRLVRAQVRPASSSTGLGAIATYRYDALGRRVSQTVHDVRTLYLHGGAQVLAEVIRPALPEASQLAGGTDPDGSVANAALPPASGGVLPTSGPGAVQQRINFQPETVAIPSGFHGDRGLAFGVRSNGLSYGWDAANTGDARVRRGVSRLVEADTLIHFAKTVPRSWSIALPNGIYPVVVVAGDAAYRDQIDNLQIGGELVIDPDPNGGVAGGTGDFDGYAVLAHVTDGRMTISMGYGGSNAKICWVEIGSAVDASYTIPQSVQDRLAAMVQQASAMTATTPEVVQGEREFVYGGYVDEVVAYTQTVAGVTKRYYPHYNHLYSVAALTDGTTGAVVERYSYDAYGKQKITDASGNVIRAKSSVGWDRGFTGYVTDPESGLSYARNRMYSPGLGRFIGRDPAGFPDGYNAYAAEFIPNYLDSSGTYIEEDYTPNTDVGAPWSDARLPKNKGGNTVGSALATCWCDPCYYLTQDASESPCGKMVNCRIKASYWIEVDTQKLPFQGKKHLWTVENVYGHEQQHIRSHLSFLRQLKEAYERETGYCTEPETCEAEAKRIAAEMNLMIDDFDRRERDHANPGSPPDKTPVDPNGPLPPRSN